ncbi:MAG TPA: ubiquinol-cytochrome C chaperone family protein [Geminicoccaceae bacterium]
MRQAGQSSPPARGFWARWWPHRDPGRRARRDAAFQLYRTIVNNARAPAFFSDLGVPDTPEGRFEMVALHAALVMRRLNGEAAEGRALAQELFDLMFADVDVNLRELGVGDLSVGKYVKRFARQFYARAEILEQTLAGGDPARLRGFLASNVWRGGAPARDAALDRLVDHLYAWAAALDEVAGPAVLAGRLDADRLPVPSRAAEGAGKAIDRAQPAD